MNTNTMIIVPIATEKAYYLINTKNEYLFRVPLKANKNQIADAVKQQFDVTPVKVRVSIQSGKAIRFNQGKGRNPGTTNRKDTKKAYVRLKDGDSIKVFAEADSAKETK